MILKVIRWWSAAVKADKTCHRAGILAVLLANEECLCYIGDDRGVAQFG